MFFYRIIIFLFLFQFNTAFAEVNKKEIKNSLDDFSSFAYAIDPTYGIEKDDLAIVKKNPNTKFAIGIALNSELKIKEDDKKFIRENPNTLFAFALAQNSNYFINKDDLAFIENNPSTLLTFGLTRNPHYFKRDIKNNKPLFINNFEIWLEKNGMIMPEWAYFIGNILMTPIDFLDNNFLLFDFLNKPILEWTGWSIIHLFITLMLFSLVMGIFIPRNVNNK